MSSRVSTIAFILKTQAARPTPTDHGWEGSLCSPTYAFASLPTCFKGRHLWRDQTMQLGKTGIDFLIKQKRAALLGCNWCGTGLERKWCSVTISLTHWSVVRAIGCAFLFDYEYWLKTLVLKPLKSLVKLSLIWARPRLDPLWLFKGQR